MAETPPSGVDVRVVRYLRILVTILTAVMVVGMIVLVTVFVMRFPDGTAQQRQGGPEVPQVLDLPKGVWAEAVARTEDFWVIVAETGDVYFFDRAGGKPLRHVPAPE